MLLLRKQFNLPEEPCHLRKVKGHKMEAGKRRKLECWVNCAQTSVEV